MLRKSFSLIRSCSFVSLEVLIRKSTHVNIKVNLNLQIKAKLENIKQKCKRNSPLISLKLFALHLFATEIINNHHHHRSVLAILNLGPFALGVKRLKPCASIGDKMISTFKPFITYYIFSDLGNYFTNDGFHHEVSIQ